MGFQLLVHSNMTVKLQIPPKRYPHLTARGFIPRGRVQL